MKGKNNKRPRPNYWWSMLSMRCPRCRRGSMFVNGNPWKLKKLFHMHECCTECKQPFDLEPGFWYGTGYVSYGLGIALSIASFALWYFTIGMSTKDTRLFWWLGSNAVLLIVLQPWLIRISRTIYLYFFVRYDEDYETNPVQRFDY